MRARAEGAETPALGVGAFRYGAGLVTICGRAATLTLLAALLAGGRAAAVDAQPDLAWIDRAALDNGEVQVSSRTDHLTVHIKVAVQVDAPPQAIWDVLTSCQTAPEYVPN